MAKKDLIWNNEKWVIDYETRTIYQKGVTSGLPVQVTIGNYSFNDFDGELYFTTGKGFYKVVKEQVVEISKDEYEEIKNCITLNKKDPATSRYISNYVVSIIINDLMREKFNLKVLIPADAPLINNYSRKFTPKISSEINWITRDILIQLPNKIKRSDIKNQVIKIYNNIKQESQEYLNQLIDIIYLNDKERFDELSENINNSHKSKRK